MLPRAEDGHPVADALRPRIYGQQQSLAIFAFVE
jgi:hypothetical protein